MKNKIFAGLAIAAVALSVVACGQKTPEQKVEEGLEKIEEGLNDAGTSIGEVVEGVVDEAEAVGEAVVEGAEELGEAVVEGAEELIDGVEEGVDETKKPAE